MAQNNNFTRSNVNAKSLILTDPNRSSFDLSRKSNMTIPFGRIVPVGCDFLLPTDTFSGSVTPEFQFEKIATPSIGPTRLDTHTFLVNARRINNQLKQNVEQEKAFFPQLDYQTIWTAIALLFRGGQIGGTSVSNKTYSAAQITWDYAKNLPSSDDFAWFPTFVYQSYHRISDYATKIASGDLKDTPFYQADKIKQFADYIFAFYEANHTEGPQRNTIFVEFWFYVLEFFIGRSTLFDYLGYPIVTEYSESYLSWTNKIHIDKVGPSSYLNYMKELSTNLTSPTMPPSAALVHQTELGNMAFGLFSASNQPQLLDYPFERLTEGPLRAYYAVWYDYLRNFHIELRSKVIDPDLFDNNKVVNFLGTSPLDIARFVAKFLLFYTLQYRTYNTDFLTSIQTEDVYRHVYSPVLANISSEVYATTPNSNYESIINNISDIGLLDNTKQFAFPGGSSISYDTTSKDSSDTLMSDLQTMRRAGMLEKWLARNYYFPDTYVGRIQARFGINPSDTNYLVSQYIGGSEKFISGEQNVANITSGDSVVGQRNLVANVSDSNTFSGSVSDYTFLVSVVSLVPIVSYDIINPALFMSDFTDIPSPEYASDSRVEARTSDFLRGFVRKPFIGYVPRYYNFRVHGDETHGRYLTDYRSYSWFRDWYSMNISGNEFSLNPYSLRVHLPLDAFLGLNDWDDVCFGTCSVGLAINRPLPAAIEVF